MRRHLDLKSALDTASHACYTNEVAMDRSR
jgi:hypothetical protein